jgi:peptidoglycan/xylan/chitin deacetylase (PgdA/CDA1 family)
MKFLKQAILLSSLLPGAGLYAQALEERPPQYVLLAFDNCQENETWEGVTNFLEEMNKINKNTLRFTFFVSGVGLLSNDKASQYKNPSFLATESKSSMKDPEKSLFPERANQLKRGRDFPVNGKSNIGFGGTQQELRERVAHINHLYNGGNEMASHAVGHFNAKKWTKEMWSHEMNEYNKIINNIGSLNGDEQLKLVFKASDITGFRAPYLEGNSALLSNLAEHNYSYDTSDTAQGWDPKTWPKKYAVKGAQNIWNFGLGFINAYGHNNLKLPAMDYNFCYRQGNGCPEVYPETMKTAEKDGRNMLMSYLKYFVDNYNGNRAPVHIGHHFYQYRGGVYNKALFEFAKIVCSQPEVKCVTYKELAAFMNTKTDSQVKNIQQGLFPKAESMPNLDELARQIDW